MEHTCPPNLSPQWNLQWWLCFEHIVQSHHQYVSFRCRFLIANLPKYCSNRGFQSTSQHLRGSIQASLCTKMCIWIAYIHYPIVSKAILPKMNSFFQCTFKWSWTFILSNIWIERHDMGALGYKCILHILMNSVTRACILISSFIKGNV